jgi:hypothetical protein
MPEMREKKSNAPRSRIRVEREAIEVLGGLQVALRGLIQSTPGATRRPADLTRTLGIPAKLAWQVHKLAHAADPLAEASNIPGAAGMHRFLEAAARRGAPVNLVEAVRTAQNRFDQTVAVHAGNRGEFGSIVSGLARDGSEQVDLSHKRAAFRAQGHIFGIQANAQLACFIYRPSNRAPQMLDCATLRGLIGVRRFRPTARWIVARVRYTDDDGVIRRAPPREPIDPAPGPAHEVGLLTKYCSRPLPAMRYIPDGSGFMNVEAEGTSLGNQSAMTCLFGEVFREVFARYRDEHNLVQSSSALVRVPAKVLIEDVLAPAHLFSRQAPRILVYGDHQRIDQPKPVRESDLLALRESVIYLGRGLSVLATPEVPRYEKMAGYAFDRLGWNPDEFDVYRCRVEYPVMPSTVVTQFDLPEPPAAEREG